MNHLFFMPKIPTAATVPKTVEQTAVAPASTNVFFSACIVAASRSISLYQYVEKPLKFDVLLAALNENITITISGIYITAKITAI